MAYISAEAAANAVMEVLNSEDFGVTFTRSDMPKYALKDLATTKAHVVLVFPMTMEPLGDEGASIDTPIAITIDAACEKMNRTKVDELTTLVENITYFLTSANITNLGYPVESPQIDRNPDFLDQGHYCAGVGVVYRRFRGLGG